MENVRLWQHRLIFWHVMQTFRLKWLWDDEWGHSDNKNLQLWFSAKDANPGKTKNKRVFLWKLQNINISSWYCCCCWNHLLEFGWLPRETYRLSVHLSFMLSSLTNACKHQRWVLQFTLKIYFMKDIETNCNKRESG